MIFWTWRSYFICWQIFENKVWCPVSKKRTKYFHFLLSLAYPIDRLDWALFSVVILFHHLFPLLEKVEILVFILPRNFPAVLIIFTGRGGAGNPPLPTARGGAGNPPFPAGRVPRGTGRPSLLCRGEGSNKALTKPGSIWPCLSPKCRSSIPRRISHLKWPVKLFCKVYSKELHMGK